MLFNSTAPHGSKSIPNNVLSTSRSGGVIREKWFLELHGLNFKPWNLIFQFFFLNYALFDNIQHHD